MTKNRDSDYKSSQKSWKMCTLCGYATPTANGGTERMSKHFQKCWKESRVDGE